MKSLTTILRTLACISLISMTSSNVSAGSFFYDWVPDSGSGGGGYIQFDDTNILDPENFVVTFDSTNVIDVPFIFDMGFNVEDAVNFTGAATLQDPAELGNSDVFASNGVMDNWSMNYINASVIVPQSSYLDVSVIQAICFIAPCPVLSVDVDFIGHLAAESNMGSWQYRAVVPVPAALPLFISGISAFGQLRIFRRK